MNSNDFGWIGQVLADIQIFGDMDEMCDLATSRRTISREAAGFGTDETQVKGIHSPAAAEELILFSMCATCVHAHSSGNSARATEIRETINRKELASGLPPAAIGYCEDREPLVKDCPMASRRGN